ncbi:MAG: DUF262 domain-containing protein [Gammaproteobacteria bacterium]|nr:DUF262 domain-containing protein [Gammaproteobacteria bacterium]
MKIELKEITVAELVDGYADKADEGVVGYGGRLDIRPPYQREFIYKDAQRDAVIDTLHKGFPLNVMYWAVRDDGDFEVIDGQQRTISICQFVQGLFSCRDLFGVDQPRAFHNLQDDEQDKIRDYKLTVYLCTGNDSEKLEWFKTINIAGAELTDQELRNAVYSGAWVTDAKRYFSKRGCAAYGLGGDYLSGSAIRQEYLETAIKWLAGGKSNIETYMGKHQQDTDAKPLWAHFRAVIAWVQKVFPQYRREMKGLDWGAFYAEFKGREFDAEKLERDIVRLMQDDDIKKKSGIYAYLLTGGEHHLNIRAFTPAQKRSAFERQKGKCPVCKKQFGIDEMEGDHITPWREGGKTEPGNCQMLCKECNRRKGGR